MTRYLWCENDFFSSLLDFRPAARVEFLAGPRMFGNDAARAVESLRFDDAGAYPAHFHLPVLVRFEAHGRDFAVSNSGFQRFCIGWHVERFEIRVRSRLQRQRFFRQSVSILNSQTAGEVEGCSITGAGRTELGAAAASAEIGTCSDCASAYLCCPALAVRVITAAGDLFALAPFRAHLPTLHCGPQRF